MAAPKRVTKNKATKNTDRQQNPAPPVHSDAEAATRRVLQQHAAEAGADDEAMPLRGAESSTEDSTQRGHDDQSTDAPSAAEKANEGPAGVSGEAEADQPAAEDGSYQKQTSATDNDGGNEITPELIAAVKEQLRTTEVDDQQHQERANAARERSQPQRSRKPRLSMPDLSQYEPSDAMDPRELERWRYSLDLSLRRARASHDDALNKHADWVREVSDARQAGVPEEEIASVAATRRYPVPSYEETDAI